MKNELFVVWLLGTSERARAAVGDILGNLATRDLLRRINRFGQAESELEELAARIRVAFAPPQLPAVLTDEHLRMLVRAETRATLAEVLGGPDTEVLGVLLDPERLAQALRAAGDSEMGALDDAELLLYSLLPRLSRLAARHGLDARDWGGFLERQGWLTPTAQERLRALARRREWSTDRPTRVLAGVLEGVGRQHEPDMGPRYDAFALIELRRRAVHLAELLRRDAVEEADEAARLAPDLTSVANLPAWIDLYERNAVAVGLERLFTGSTSIRELLENAEINLPPATGDLKPDGILTVTNVVGFRAFRKRFAFDVACEMDGQPEPVPILQV